MLRGLSYMAASVGQFPRDQLSGFHSIGPPVELGDGDGESTPSGRSQSTFLTLKTVTLEPYCGEHLAD
jgi:hypothetical protein